MHFRGHHEKNVQQLIHVLFLNYQLLDSLSKMATIILILFWNWVQHPAQTIQNWSFSQ